MILHFRKSADIIRDKKIANDKDITTDIVYAICNALEVTPNDIMEYVPGK